VYNYPNHSIKLPRTSAISISCIILNMFLWPSKDLRHHRMSEELKFGQILWWIKLKRLMKTINLVFRTNTTTIVIQWQEQMDTDVPNINTVKKGQRLLTSTLAASWLRGSVVRTPVFDRQTFPVPRSTYSWRVITYVGKPSAIGQPTTPTQPFILSRMINWVVTNFSECVLVAPSVKCSRGWAGAVINLYALCVAALWSA